MLAARGPGRRLAVALVLVLVTGVAAFGVLAPPERCGTVTAAELRGSVDEAVDWFARNQEPDGAWLYLYEAEPGIAPADYNAVRHSGVLMSLYQAAAAGIPGAIETADQGLPWLRDRLIERDDWAAVTYGGGTSVGATALLVAGLAERRIHTGDDRHDRLLRRLGRFLAAQTEPSGAVLAYYDTGEGRPVPGEYSRYYTGEAYWALARLHGLFADGRWGEVADRVGAYLAVDRDRAEGLWPPLPDHWAAYGLAETVGFAERGVRPLTDEELAYARRQAGLFGAQLRWISQQHGPWGELVRGTNKPRGGGYGVTGEALTGLWRVAQAEPRLADIRAPLAERATCLAALTVEQQVGPDEAEGFEDPGRVRGAWLDEGETRMDDQQHAMSALLGTVPIVEAGQIGTRRPDSPSAWLWLAALLAAFNPFRSARSVPRGDRNDRTVVALAALGGAIGAGAALAVALAGEPFLDAIDVSEPALRIAAGAVGVVAGIAAMLRRSPAPEPALPGWRAALVPVAIPLVATPALILLAIGAYADRGAAVVVAALAIGVAALTGLVARGPAEGAGGGLLGWAARLSAAVLVAASVLLVIDGIFAV